MMRLRRRNNRRVFLIAVTVIALGSCLWLVFRPRPSLAPALALAEQRHLDAAEERVRAYLKEYPQSNAGTLLLAQIQLGLAENNAPTGNTPDPESVLKVLANLRLVRPENRKMAASVKLCQGKAEYYLSQFDQAEASWNEALLLEPTIPVAGWSLLDLYYIEGRNEESRHLALTLFEVEPDPHDRVQLLLELVRQDAQPPAPASIVQWFEPRVQQNPGDVHGNIALGLALVRDGKTDRGLRILETTKEHHPELADAWEAWLTGLDDANQVGAEPLSRLVQATERLPSALAVSSRFAKFQARAAQERGETKEAVAAYRRAVSAAPRDQRVEYRFIRACGKLVKSRKPNSTSALTTPGFRQAKRYARSTFGRTPSRRLGPSRTPTCTRKLPISASEWACPRKHSRGIAWFSATTQTTREARLRSKGSKQRNGQQTLVRLRPPRPRK